MCGLIKKSLFTAKNWEPKCIMTSPHHNNGTEKF